MAQKSQPLSRRKAELLVQSTILREQLAVEALEIIQMPESLSKGLSLLKQFKQIKYKSVFFGVALLALFIIKPRRIMKVFNFGRSAFGIFGRVSPFLSPFIDLVFRRK